MREALGEEGGLAALSFENLSSRGLLMVHHGRGFVAYLGLIFPVRAPHANCLSCQADDRAPVLKD